MFKVFLIISIIVQVILAKSTLNPNDCLNHHDSLSSPNGCFKLIMQGDGNLVIYRNSDNHAVWNSNTARTCSNRACMQYDGNFVVYDCHNMPTWNSGTVNNGGSKILMQNDGNLVIYGHNSNQAVWASNTQTHC